jgi:hypothetical protein
MATELPFPKTRHVALVITAPPPQAARGAGADVDAAARAEAAQAVVLPLEAPLVDAGAASPDETAIAPASPADAGAPQPSPATTLAASPAANPVPAATSPAAGAPVVEPGALPRALSVDLSQPRDGDEACLNENGERAGGGEPVRCPNSLGGRAHAAQLAVRAAGLADAVVLQGLSRWYALGPLGAGYCSSCEHALIEALRGTYGEHVLRFPVLSGGRARSQPAAARPFAGLRQALRLSEPLEAAKRSILSARDEARRQRGVELAVFAQTGPLCAFGLALCRHLDGLVFTLPSADPLEALFPLLAARAALGERPAVALAPASATPDQVTQLSALATACDADLALPPDAPAAARAALTAHRRYQNLVRERFRPAGPLADLELFVSPRADHFSGGAHLRASSLAAAALATAHIQLAVRVDQPSATPQGRKLLVLAGCEALPEEQAPALRRHVQAGGDLLLAGPCHLVDEEGNRGEPLFADLKPGLDRYGEGRIWAIDPQGPLTAPAQLPPLLLRAARDLLGRGQQSLTLSGRGQLLARAYLDPERKLDVHLVNLDLREGGFGPAQGLMLHIAGQAAGGGRAGYWFAPERAGGRDGERISLNPSGFSVSTVLPNIGANALLAVPR